MRRLCLWLLLIGLPPAVALGDEALGRLFFTPAERANLDYLRQTSQPPEKTLSPDDATEPETDVATPPPAPPSSVSMQGYVKPSQGRGTVWVNRQPVQEKTSHGELSVGKLGPPGSAVRVKVPGTDQTVELKAGQTYDAANGKVLNTLRPLPAAPADAGSTPAEAPAAKAAPENPPVKPAAPSATPNAATKTP